MGFECKCEGGAKGQTISSVLISSFRRGSFRRAACKIEHHLMVGRQTVGGGDLNAHLIWDNLSAASSIGVDVFFTVDYKCLQNVILVTFISFGAYVHIYYSILCILRADAFVMFKTRLFIYKKSHWNQHLQNWHLHRCKSCNGMAVQLTTF